VSEKGGNPLNGNKKIGSWNYPPKEFMRETTNSIYPKKKGPIHTLSPNGTLGEKWAPEYSLARKFKGWAK